MADSSSDSSNSPPLRLHAQQQSGERRVRLRVDTSEIKSTYANAFQTAASRDEVVLELGFKHVVPSPPPLEREGEEAGVEVQLELGHRVIVTYPTLKRLAIAIGQVVRGYEVEHGEIELEEQAGKNE